VHEPNRAVEVPPTTTASFSGSRLAAGPLALAVGRARIEMESIELRALEEGVAAFEGLRPRGASFIARDLRIQNLRISF